MVAKKDTEVLPKRMTATERKEIRRIVAKDFDLLRAEINQMSEDMLSAGRKQVRESFKAQVAEAEKASTKMKAEARKLTEKWNETIRTYAEKGIRPTNRHYAEVSLPTSWEPISLQDALRAKDEEIRRSLNAAIHHVNKQEAEYDRQLALNAIESTEAQEFIARIPQASDVLNLANTEVRAAIQAAK